MKCGSLLASLRRELRVQPRAIPLDAKVTQMMGNWLMFSARVSRPDSRSSHPRYAGWPHDGSDRLFS